MYKYVQRGDAVAGRVARVYGPVDTCGPQWAQTWRGCVPAVDLSSRCLRAGALSSRSGTIIWIWVLKASSVGRIRMRCVLLLGYARWCLLIRRRRP